jgi:excisionase family DNA binding protein
MANNTELHYLTLKSGATSMPAKTKRTRKSTELATPSRFPDVLDVEMTAKFLTVSTDTVYSLFQEGELPGRKVGRKWVTTKAAVLRWIETSSADDTLTRAAERGDQATLIKALNSGKIRVKSTAA